MAVLYSVCKICFTTGEGKDTRKDTPLPCFTTRGACLVLCDYLVEAIDLAPPFLLLQCNLLRLSSWPPQRCL